MTVFFHALFYSTHIPMFTVFDPLLEFTYHLLFSWRKFALCIQSLLCMLFLFGWPPCQRSDMIVMEVSQHAFDMIHYISGLFGYFYVCEIYVNLMWYLYLFMLNKFCLSLSLSWFTRILFKDIASKDAIHISWFQDLADIWLTYNISSWESFPQ